MAEAEAGASSKPAASLEVTEEVGGLLDQVVEATNVDRSEVDSWVAELLRTAGSKGKVLDKNVSNTIDKRIAQIDAAVSEQLAEIMHHSEFQKLEGSWRGLHHMVFESETGTALKIRLFNASKKDLTKDMESATDFDQSNLFKKIYENEFGMPGGEPYGALIGDYQWENNAQDVKTLEKVSGIAASAFAPFISGADASVFKLNNYTELNKIPDLAQAFDSDDYIKWNALRESDDARFLYLTAPRVLSRLPYGTNDSTTPIDEFEYNELPMGSDASSLEVDNDQYCWMNSAYVLGTRLTSAFAQTGWCTAIRGVQNGGKVEGLPTHLVKSADGDTKVACPTEVAIGDRREKELSDLGFLPLCHFKKTDYAVFFGAQSMQKAKKYDNPNATANAAISARLPYIMASSRIAHFLKCIARDKIGSFAERSDMQDMLERWIATYVSSDDKPSEEMKARYPLAEARIEVEEVPGAPGSYNAVAHLRPWMQMEELTTSLRMVAKLPAQAG